MPATKPVQSFVSTKKKVSSSSPRIKKKSLVSENKSSSVSDDSISSNSTPQGLGLLLSSASGNWSDDLSSDPGSDPGSLSSSEVFDEADHAQSMNLRELADIHRRARIMNRPETHPDFDGKHCVACDDPIPPQRLRDNRVRCVDCQSLLEESLRRQGSVARR